MWTTLGFEQITPKGFTRVIVAAEAITGAFSIAMLISLVWIYAQHAFDRRWETEPTEAPDIRLRSNDRFGFMDELDPEGRPKIILGADLFASRCERCQSEDVNVHKIRYVIHEFVQLPRFVTVCENCKRVGPVKFTATAAVKAWNRKNV